ncbi:MAG TPA: hypothetical protein VLU73_03855 [Methylococcaceae bacterium]|nr:hypothetical protein [Methylococcaceae bacterium]
MNARRMSHSFSGNIVLVAFVAALLGCAPAPDPNVSTHHNDNFRTGAYLAETVLTPKAVRDRGMHIKYWLIRCDTFIAAAPPGNPVGCFDGTIETQPLFVHQQHFKVDSPVGVVETTAGGLFIATAHNKVYGFIASTGQQMWATDLMLDKNHQPLNGGFEPRGANSTPVIDVGNNRMYVLFSNKLPLNEPWQDCSGLDGNPKRLCDFGNYKSGVFR